jgi:TRAP-type mannitol/chloroaromatic compound transport system substrate-binding protein
LASDVRRFGEGDYDLRVPLDGPPEISSSLQAFNHMAGKLQESTERLVYLRQLESWQTLARKMAHEVKNSLTPIRLTVEEMLARYDAANPPALKQLVASGIQLRPFPPDVMEACLKAANELYAEIGAQNAEFKKMHDAYMTFRNNENLWFQVAEYSFDNFQIRTRPKG